MSSTATSVLSKPEVDSSETPSSDSCLGSGVKAEPFQDLKLASHEALEKAQLKGRLKCPRCHGSRMFYCYTCFSLVGVNQQEIPKLKLPVKIDIIKHPNETDGKSTAVHAKLLAPDDVTIYTFPCIPEYDGDKVVLVFPGPESVTVEEMAARLTGTLEDRQGPSPEEPRAKRLKWEDQSSEGGSVQPHKEAADPPLTRVVFIDSTWNQTNKIITDERLQALLQVELKMRKTCFWRHQKGSPDTYLATIEAIYYFLKDYHTQCLSKDYDGDYDDLLYFFTYLHKLINGAKHAAGKL